VPDPKLQVLREVYPPGGDTGPDLLTHPGEEAGVVVRGSISVTVGGQEKLLQAGDAYYFNSRIPHRFRNLTDKECEIISSATPRSF
jgi:quercetin dioxygenase-like cupin family protein